MNQGFKFSNEEIVWLFKHFTDYISVIENNTLKQLKFAEKQLELTQELYGNEKDFDNEEVNLQLQLVKEELPKVIKERLLVIEKVKEKFEDAYMLMTEVDPDFVSSIENKYFTESEPIKDILERIKNKHNGNYED